jgi:outer membrane lipoprotein-sorting protein
MLSTFLTLAAMQAGSLNLPILAPAPPAATVETDVSGEASGPVRDTARPGEADAPVVRVQGEKDERGSGGAERESSGTVPTGPDTAQSAPDTSNPPAGETQGGDAPARAQLIDPPRAPAALSPTERRATVKAASEALSRVETATGRFVQVDASGQLTEGSFALKRPGRMRFDYDAPTPLLIAADGATVAIRDNELETVDRVPLASTPLGLILDDDLDFEKEAEILDVRKANGVVSVSLRDRTGEAEGTLTLIFDAGSYQLVSWRAEDPSGGTTTVRLSNVRTGVSLNPRLFIVEDFEDDEDDRGRRR